MTDQDAKREGRGKVDASQLSPRVRCLSLRDLEAAGHGSVRDIRQKVKDKKFPQPFRIGNRFLWREATIIAFLDRQEKAKAV